MRMFQLADSIPDGVHFSNLDVHYSLIHSLASCSVFEQLFRKTAKGIEATLQCKAIHASRYNAWQFLRRRGVSSNVLALV